MNPDLSAEEERLLTACFEQNNGEGFDFVLAGRTAGFSDSESDDLAIVLGQKGLFDGMHYGTTAVFNPMGRVQARRLIANREEARAARTGITQIVKRNPPQQAQAVSAPTETAKEPDGDKWELLLDAAYAVEPDDPHAWFNYEAVAKAAGFADMAAASHYFRDLHNQGKIKLETRAEGSKVVEEFKRRQELRRIGEHSGVPTMLTRERILSIPNGPDAKNNEEADRRAAASLGLTDTPREHHDPTEQFVDNARHVGRSIGFSKPSATSRRIIFRCAMGFIGVAILTALFFVPILFKRNPWEFWNQSLPAQIFGGVLSGLIVAAAIAMFAAKER